MIRKAGYVLLISILVSAIGIVILNQQRPIGPAVFGISLIPILALHFAKRNIISATPDIIFGAIDTGLLTIPALWGGIFFGLAGAIAGSVIGDAITDAIAGFFEGHISEWLRYKGIQESREAVTTGLGKMAGCLLGCGIVLTIALLYCNLRPT